MPENAAAIIASLTIPIAVLILVASAFGLLVMMAKNYHTVSPNQVAVVSGRRRTMGEGLVGYRVITGGGFLKLPVLERVDYLLLNVMSFPVEVINVPAVDGPTVTVKGIANVKIQSDAASLGLAIERFLGRQTQEIQSVAKENLESNLRAIVGTLTIEQLIKDRQSLQSNVMKEAVTDLAKLGLGLDLLNIQDVKDDKGYIESLGKKQTAEVKKNAAIGEAEAAREALIKSSEADRLGKEARAQADQKISNAVREKEMIEAENKAQSDAARARISIRADIAKQEEQAKLNVQTVEAEKARVKADTELQDLEHKRNDARLKATVIVQAEREKEATLIRAEADQQARIIRAEADQQAAVREGEAQRIRQEKDGQGQQALQVAQAEGRKATASAMRAELEAKAAGEQALLVAQATGEQAKLMAQAEGRRALVLAEAEGIMKKAEAYKKMDDGGRFLLILEASTPAIQAAGHAFGDAIRPLADSIGEGLKAIDNVQIMDFGGAGGRGPMHTMGDYPIETMAKLWSQVKAAGLLPGLVAIAERAGIQVPADLKGNPTDTK